MTERLKINAPLLVTVPVAVVEPNVPVVPPVPTCKVPALSVVPPE